VLSNEGGMPLSEHLDHPAILASEFDTLERVFSVLAGARAETTDDLPPQSGKIIVTPPWFDEPLDDSVAAAIDSAAALLAGMGYAVEQRDVAPVVAGEEECLMTILTHDMARNHGADYDRASDQMSEFLRGLIEAGRRVSREQYDVAVARRAEITSALEDWLPRDGMVLSPAVTGPAPRRSEGTGSRAPQRLWTFAGWPALAVPGWWDDHLPIGVQLVGRHGADRQVLAVGRRLWWARKADQGG